MQVPGGLDVVAETVRRELDALYRRTDAADARAGLLLGFAGLLASLGTDGWWPLALSARFFSALAALTALAALSVDADQPLDQASLLDLGRADAATARAAITRAEADAWTWIAVLHRRKVAYLRRASRYATASLAFAVLAATVG